MGRTVVLRHIRDEDGLQSLSASLRDDGTVTLEGQDLGAGVSSFFGEEMTEYEFAFTVAPGEVPALRAALGAEGDVLAALQAQFAPPDAPGPKAFLDAHAIDHTFWSRLGD